jgi:hypothetical protein
MRNLQKDFFSLAKFLNEFLGNKGISSFKGISRSLKAAYSGPAGYVHCTYRKENKKYSKVQQNIGFILFCFSPCTEGTGRHKRAQTAALSWPWI